MAARSFEELLVYQKALAASDEISDLIRRPCFEKDLRLRTQMGASSERIASVIAEGFAQSTDRHVASYLYRSRGSTNEIRTQLRVALKREYITEDERDGLCSRYDEIARMLTGRIAHEVCTQPSIRLLTADCGLLTVDC